MAPVDVAFKSLDGVVLKGWLFSATKGAPAIIMTPGFNAIKSSLEEVAKYFHGAGFTVLLFDPRCTGASGGEPRQELHPARNVEDYHDAFTFLKTLPGVDPGCIVYWGYSFSGMIALCAAAMDKRARAVIAVSPMTIWDCSKRDETLQEAMQDRELRSAGQKPAIMPMLDEQIENPAGLADNYKTELSRGHIAMAAKTHLDFEPYTTTSSYYHIMTFSPFKLMPFVSPTPAMIVVGAADKISPSTLQEKLIYDILREPKRMVKVPNKGHMNILRDRSFRVLQNQVDFLLEIFGSRVGGGDEGKASTIDPNYGIPFVGTQCKM